MHHVRNLWSFLAAYHCQFKPRADSDSISAGSWLKLAVMTQYHCRFLAKTDSDMNRQWRPEYQCQLVLSLLVLAKYRQWWAITVGFSESGVDVQFCSGDRHIGVLYWGRGTPSTGLWWVHAFPRRHSSSPQLQQGTSVGVEVVASVLGT
jgi:hypothetical protein